MCPHSHDEDIELKEDAEERAVASAARPNQPNSPSHTKMEQTRGTKEGDHEKLDIHGEHRGGHNKEAAKPKPCTNSKAATDTSSHAQAIHPNEGGIEDAHTQVVRTLEGENEEEVRAQAMHDLEGGVYLGAKKKHSAICVDRQGDRGRTLPATSRLEPRWLA